MIDLPTIEEFRSIVDKTTSPPYKINSTFKHIQESAYWSSTTSSLASKRWAVYFKDGREGLLFTSNNLNVRCVR